MSKPHGNTGKQNALKGDEALRARVAFRLPQSVKDAADKEAARLGVSASQWHLKAVEKALGNL